MNAFFDWLIYLNYLSPISLASHQTYIVLQGISGVGKSTFPSKVFVDQIFCLLLFVSANNNTACLLMTCLVLLPVLYKLVTGYILI